MGRQKAKAETPREKKYTSEEIHRAIFKEHPKARTLEELKGGVEKYIREKHARR